jgi:hypothetical protein
MPVQAFVDDSGGRGQGRYLVSCGLVAHSDHWAAFSDKWTATLAAAPPIRYFKMREAASFSHQFYRFSETQRNDKLIKLASIIDRYAQFVVFSAFDLDAHEQTWFKSNAKPLNEPYFWTFHNTIHAVMFELWDIGWRERFEIIFDEQDIFGPRARNYYPAIRAAMTVREPEASALLPVDPIFRSDVEFLPLQACDLIAWCGRKDATDPSNRRFAFLDDVIRKPYASDYSQFYDLDRLKDVLAMSREEYKKLTSGEYPELLEAAERYREVWES